MKLILSYSGHDPDIMVEVSDAEYAKIRKLTKQKFLFDTEEGRALFNTFRGRPNLLKDVPVEIAYQ